ncbi:MAG: DoxX family protein [Deltaproteobacteria bacterium]|nr:MAG: DoxX family protein [Deltaproteobacteria bacterium]
MSRAKTVSVWLMGAFYVIAGLNHFRAPEFYLPIMPPYLPWHSELIFLSGVAEVMIGVGLLVPRARVLAAWGAIALLVAVYPANIHQALADVQIGNPPHSVGALRWIRLPIQFVLMAWAYWHTRPEPT